MDDRGQGKHQQLHILWDNAFDDWKSYQTVYKSAPNIVKQYQAGLKAAQE
jgi:hypothetical protein